MGKAKAAKLVRRAERERWAGRELWHGGIGGLAVGEELIAPTDQQLHDPMSTAQFMPEARADRVYFTTDPELARVFASAVYHGRGSSALYRVAPIGPVLADPDFPTVGFHSRRALILEVAESDVQLAPQEEQQRQAPYLTWDDGRPIYDADGRVQVTWQMEEYGITQHDLDARFAPWTNPKVVTDEVAALLARSRG